MSKVAYNNFSAPEWRAMKQAFRHHNQEQLVEELRLQMQAAMKRHQHSGDAASNATADMFFFFVYIFDRINRCQHYFVAPGVADFCIASVKECTPEYYRDFPPTPPVRLVAENAFPFSGGMFFHFPAKEHRQSFYLAPRWICPVSATYAVTARAMIQWADGTYIRFGEDKFCPSAQFTENVKLILGLSLYMDAFPDAIVPASDHSVHHLRHYAGDRRQISRAAVMEHEEKQARSPHWRRGHFRVLHSERFRHKRGQAVFVKGAFVRGVAFDIRDDAPPAGA